MLLPFPCRTTTTTAVNSADSIIVALCGVEEPSFRLNKTDFVLDRVRLCPNLNRRSSRFRVYPFSWLFTVRYKIYMSYLHIYIERDSYDGSSSEVRGVEQLATF